MALVGPAPLSFNPVRRLSGDLLAERRTEVPFPPGGTWFSVRRTRGFALHPLPLLLDAYERFGPVYYSSWVSHHLARVFPEPRQFRPERFAPEAKAALPKGAYVPFGAGSRICIEMRFGQLELKAIATALVRRFEFELEPGNKLRIRQMPTIGPRDGVPLIVHRRDRSGRAVPGRQSTRANRGAATAA